MRPPRGLWADLNLHRQREGLQLLVHKHKPLIRISYPDLRLGDTGNAESSVSLRLVDCKAFPAGHRCGGRATRYIVSLTVRVVTHQFEILGRSDGKANARREFQALIGFAQRSAIFWFAAVDIFWQTSTYHSNSTD